MFYHLRKKFSLFLSYFPKFLFLPTQQNWFNLSTVGVKGTLTVLSREAPPNLPERPQTPGPRSSRTEAEKRLPGSCQPPNLPTGLPAPGLLLKATENSLAPLSHLPSLTGRACVWM